MSNKWSNIKIGKEVWFAALVVVACVTTIFVLRQSMPEISQAGPPVGIEKAIQSKSFQAMKQFKVLHIMSYHSPWKWTDDQLHGFQEALSDLDVQYKVFQMDTKRHSSEKWKMKVAAQAKEIIDTWKPDLVYTNDDNAQQYIVKDYVDTDIPFVFSAVNAEPMEYGFVGSKNVTGVLERMHYVQTVQLLKQLVPNVRKIAIITDSGKMWGPMIESLKLDKSELPKDVEVVGYYVIDTFTEYKKTLKSFEGMVDAVGMLGVFEFKDKRGNNVPLEQVQQWTINNSKLPDFSFWKDRVDKGTLCAVTVSGLAQGQAAGRIARSILSEGRSPASYPMKATEKGIPIVNLARARKLNINPSSSVLLTAEVVTEFSK